MANVKITELTAATALAATDVLPIVDVGADATKKVSVSDLLRNLPDGTASAPALAFADDQNTGVLSPGNNSLAFATSGTQRLAIDSSGRVGIGTAAPGCDLDVFNTGFVNLKVRSSGTNTASLNLINSTRNYSINSSGGALTFYDATAGSERMRINSSGHVNIGHTSSAYADSNRGVISLNGSTSSIIDLQTATTSRFRLFCNGTDTELINTEATGALKFGTNSAERMRIDSSGRVGIGTTSPDSELSIGTGNNNNRIDLADERAYVGYDTSYGSSGALYLDGGGSANKDIILQPVSTGKVGIGTTSPTRNLVVQSASQSDILIKSGNANFGQLIFGDTDADFRGAIGYNHTGDNMAFTTAGSERMRIDSSGRLLVGTSSAPGSFPQGFTPQITASKANNGGIASLMYASANTPAKFYLGKSNTTAVGSHAVVSSGNRIGDLEWVGSDGTNFIAAARISTAVDGTPGTNDMPGRLLFSVTADGASSPTTRITLKSDGRCVFSSVPDTTISRSAGGTPPILTNSSSASTNAGIEITTDSTATRYCQIFSIATSVVGSITTSGSSTAFNTSSDYRLKENIVDIADGITRVKQLQPRRFNFIADADTTVDGFVAHEAQAVVPEAVTGTHNEVDDDGNAVMQGIDQSKLVPLLTAALQEAIAKIETLETKVAALEAQ